MRLREKLFILFIAVTVTIFGFNLIASPAFHLLQEAKEAGYKWIDGNMTKLDAEIYQIRSFGKD